MQGGVPLKTCRIAISGKGGTGKTTLAALLVTALVDAQETPVLAVDADPNANLHEALGLTMRESLGGMREDAFTRSIPPGMSRKDYIALRFRQVLVESKGFDLVAMGRPEGLGCYCFANTLLSAAMELLEKEYRWVVVDSEAGMEHISRRTVGQPDLLLVVSDPSARGVRTAERIRDLAVSIGIQQDRIYLVFNRVKPDGDRAEGSTLPLLGIIPEDSAVEDADIRGSPLAEIGKKSLAQKAVQDISEKLREMCKGSGSKE
ncbi:MAG: AAA family ATPase [Methanomicrobiales archaeon]|nr:AAA family ATPase [Methanomicrobiales archaeon]